ncbi:MAG: TetR/AcrR family transcriptional regulator [Marmoricola sp.]
MGLVRALLMRARDDELDLLESLAMKGRLPDLAEAVERLWVWLSAAEHRPLLTLWAEAYARSLVEPAGMWAGFGRTTVEDWLDVLARAQPARDRRTVRGRAQRTLALGVLRGALLDLLATGDVRRTTAAVHLHARTGRPGVREN